MELRTRAAGAKRQCSALARSSRPALESSGDEEIRTPDPLLAKEVLYQLSYIPRPDPRSVARRANVGASGLEPETSALSGQCSNHLS